VDAQGLVYIADVLNHRIRRVDPATGLISTIAGNGSPDFSGDDGIATDASLNSPAAMTFDASGNLYIADYGNHRIRKVDAGTGIITSVAGTGFPGSSGDDGLATAASLNYPIALFANASGLYISDSFNNKIRFIDNQGMMHTVAGTGTVGNSGDGSAATAATLRQPWGLVVGQDGHLYFSDSANFVVRKIANIAGGGGTTPPPTGSFTLTISKTGAGSGTVTAAAGNGSGIQCGAACSESYTENSVVNLIANADEGSLFNGWSGDCSGSGSTISLTLDTSKTCQAIFELRAQSNLIQRFAGSGNTGFSGDNGPALAAQVSDKLYGVAVDSKGNIYLADGGNNRVRKITPAGLISTVAGNGVQDYSGDGGIATAAGLTAFNVTVDRFNNLYIADGANHVIRKVDSAGIITTIAGNGTSGFSGDGELATAAQLNQPYGLSIDLSGNLYIAETGNHIIRKVDSQGVISTIAGQQGNPGFSGDNAAAATAQFEAPWAVVHDTLGNLYVADAANYRIRKITPDGLVQSIAGNGESAESGDGGPATQAGFGWPEDLAIDSANNLYIADRDNHRIRRVDAATGIISSVAGNGTSGYSGDDGPALNAQLNTPAGLVVDLADDLYIADSANSMLRQMTTGLKQRLSIELTGSSLGSISAPAGVMQGIQCDANNSLCLDIYVTGNTVKLTATASTDAEFIGWGGDCGGTENPLQVTMDQSRHCTARFDLLPQAVAQGLISTVAGDGLGAYSGEGGPATLASLKFPVALALSPSEQLLISDALNNRLRLVEAPVIDSFINRVAGNGSFGFSGDGGLANNAELRNPFGLTSDADGVVYFADSANHRIRKVASGIISTVAGMDNFGYSGDNGPALEARLSLPHDVALDSAGNLYIADSNNHRVRKVDSSGRITTIAGTGVADYSGDSGFGTLAGLNFPTGLFVTPAGEIYIADSGNHRIRKLDQNGVISTIAGSGATGFGNGAYGGDGGLALDARLNNPRAVAVDESGRIYIADQSNHRIRRIDQRGSIATLVGTGMPGFSGDGGLPSEAQLNGPTDIIIDAQGNLYIADYSNHRVRRVEADSPQLQISKSGNGDGLISGAVGLGDGIQCGGNCSEKYLKGSIITLTAAPDAEALFDSWGGHCQVDADNPLQATVTLDSDQSCVVSFSLQAGAGLPACPTSGSIDAPCNGDGQTLVNVSIGPNGWVYYATLSGTIQNQGVLESVTLAANAVINGGTLAGVIQGTAGAQAMLNSIITEANTQLNQVVIGQGATLGDNTQLAGGSLFSRSAIVPSSGMELSSMPIRLADPCPALQQPGLLDLSAKVWLDGVSLLEGINQVPGLPENGWVFQQQAGGEMSLDIEPYRILLHAQQVFHSSPFEAPAFVVADDWQNLRLFTPDDTVINAHPALQGLCDLQAEVSALGFPDLQRLSNGNLRLNLDADNWFTLRPDGIATFMPATTPLGISTVPSPVHPTQMLVQFVSIDTLGLKYMQQLNPVPVDLQALKTAAGESLVVGVNGLVEFSLEGQALKGVLDYNISQGIPPIQAQLQSEAIAGSSDQMLIYPDGSRQRLFVLP
ncbi:NHL domain-containing protein, partial [Candidatus Venteria ishoeyi]|uniref:NHL domain-containing protein n=1 Tax=Candidatus Venteria ishoeyi TaxID=1899563 RepID=UPI0015B35731